MKLSINSRGSLFLEMIVGLLVMSVVFLGAVTALKFVFKGVQNDRSESVVNDLVQQRLNEFKTRSYDQLPVIVSPPLMVTPAGNFYHDSSNFPPETVKVGPRTYTFYAVVQKIGTITGTGSSVTTYGQSDDLGLKQVTVTVLMQLGTKRLLRQGTLLVQDPQRRVLNGILQGYVKDDEGTPLSGVKVYAVEQPVYSGNSSNTGAFSIPLPVGKWNFQAAYTFYGTANVGPLEILALPDITTQDFILKKRTLGNAVAYVYYIDRPVISQVGVLPGGIQYIELFNSLPYDIPLNSISIDIDPGNHTVHTLSYNTSNAVITAKSYYLISTQAGIIYNGKAADAVTTVSSLFNTGPGLGGGVRLQWNGRANAVGWYDNAVGTTTFPLSSYFQSTPVRVNGGMATGYQLTRLVSTGTVTRIYGGDTNLYGAAFYNGENQSEMPLYNTITVPPNNSADGQAVMVSGSPAPAAAGTGTRNHVYFYCTDGISQLGSVTQSGSAVAGRATVVWINNIATGTQNFFAQAANANSESFEHAGPLTYDVQLTTLVVSNVVVPAGRPFPAPLLLDQRAGTALAYLSMTVNNRGQDSLFAGIPIKFPDRAEYAFTRAANPGYVTAIGTGSHVVVLNQGTFANPNMVMPKSVTLNVTASGLNSVESAQYTCVIQGIVKNGTPAQELSSPLEGVRDIFVVAQDAQTMTTITSAKTGANGSYSLRVLTDRQYNIRLELVSGQSMNQPAIGSHYVDTLGLAQNAVVADKDFYINTMDNGIIAGVATASGAVIGDGLVVFVSTAAMASTPPDITPLMRNQGVVLYSGVADVDGKYSIRIPVGNNYYLTAWQNGVKKEATSINVGSGMTVTRNLSWP